MTRALLELIIAGALWGFSFTATLWALKDLDVPALLFYRFMGAALIGFLPLWLFSKDRKKLWEQIRTEGRTAWIPGFCLFGALAFQTFGLPLTTATKSAFITTLYVVLVPLIAPLLKLDRFRSAHLVWVALALFGLALFQDLNLSSWSLGDSLTLLAALASAFHILSMARYAPSSKSPYILNLWQLFWTGLLSLLLFPFGERWSLSGLTPLAWTGLLSLLFGAGLLAFYLQIRAQERIPPGLASLLFLLESPFSALFAFLLLSERLSLYQGLGGILILSSCVAAIVFEENTRQKANS